MAASEEAAQEANLAASLETGQRSPTDVELSQDVRGILDDMGPLGGPCGNLGDVSVLNGPSGKVLALASNLPRGDQAA